MKEGKPYGGGWEVYGAFNNDDAFKNTTWQPIIYSLFGIRNHKLYGDSDVPYIRDDKSMVDLLKDIAYINVDKRPGYRSTSDPFYNGAKEIQEQYMRMYQFDYKKSCCSKFDFEFKQLD